jgi:hypothetical protein
MSELTKYIALRAVILVGLIFFWVEINICIRIEATGWKIAVFYVTLFGMVRTVVPKEPAVSALSISNTRVPTYLPVWMLTTVRTSNIAIFRGVRKIAKGDYGLCHVCLPLRPHWTTRLPLDGFWWNLISVYFSKIYRENSSFVKIWQE